MFRHLKLVALAASLVIVTIVGVQLLFSIKERAPTEAEFDSELRLTLGDLTFGYVVPDTLAVANLDPECQRFPDDSNPSCVKFIDTLKKLDTDLAGVLQQLDGILKSPPPSTSPEVLDSANKFLERYTLGHQANGLLLAGWSSTDTSKWAQGWKIRDRVKEESKSRT